MKKYKKILYAALMVACLACLFCQPAFAAISESDVQSQVDAVGKEAVSGNVLIWFLCAVAFLKISQKIDSFMASLGVNVGHTGGSMLAEAMIATKGIGGIRNFSRQHFSGGGSRSSTNVKANGGSGGAGFGGGFMSGGLAGVINRNITNSAVRTATTSSESKPSGSVGGLGAVVQGVSGGVGGKLYSSSVSKGGDFANNIISTVATGSIAAQGTITGEKASEALSSYMGYAALGEDAGHIPTFPTWKSVGAELPVQKLPRNTRRGLLSECTILHNMQHQKALTLRFMRQMAPPGINSMQLTRWTNLLISLRMVRLHITNLS